ncbi:unnamed protein product, partial [Urochloa humidicola]
RRPLLQLDSPAAPRVVPRPPPAADHPAAELRRRASLRPPPPPSAAPRPCRCPPPAVGLPPALDLTHAAAASLPRFVTASSGQHYGYVAVADGELGMAIQAVLHGTAVAPSLHATCSGGRVGSLGPARCRRAAPPLAARPRSTSAPYSKHAATASAYLIRGPAVLSAFRR